MKRKVSAVTLTLMLLFSSMVGMLFVNLVRSNFWPDWFTWIPHIIINSNGTISQTDQSIKQVGNVYYLTGNLSNYGITVSCDNIILDGKGFTLTSDGSLSGQGLSIASHNVTIRNFVIESVPVGIGLSGALGNMGESMEIRILNNSISNCNAGIDCWGPSNNSISKNTIESNQIGIKIHGSYYSNGASFSRGYSCFNVIDRNVVTNNGEGIHIEDANQSIISLNIITENQHGVFLNDVQGSVFAKNDIACNDCGVSLIPPSTGNVFYLNNFVNNTNNVVLHSENDLNNSWDDNSSGNYWSDYSGEGVYGIDENNIDHYPLMYPWGAPCVSLLTLGNSTYVGGFPLNFTVNKPASWIGYSLDGQDKVTIIGNVTLRGLSSGLHNVTVYASDDVENIGSSDTITFSIVEEPFPVLPVAVASIVSAGVVAVGLLVYFRRGKHAQMADNVNRT